MTIVFYTLIRGFKWWHFVVLSKICGLKCKYSKVGQIVRWRFKNANGQLELERSQWNEKLLKIIKIHKWESLATNIQFGPRMATQAYEYTQTLFGWIEAIWCLLCTLTFNHVYVWFNSEKKLCFLILFWKLLMVNFFYSIYTISRLKRRGTP